MLVLHRVPSEPEHVRHLPRLRRGRRHADALRVRLFARRQLELTVLCGERRCGGGGTKSQYECQATLTDANANTGYCVLGSCSYGFYGTTCQREALRELSLSLMTCSFALAECPRSGTFNQVCGNRGVCSSVTGLCTCNTGYNGPACQVRASCRSLRIRTACLHLIPFVSRDAVLE